MIIKLFEEFDPFSFLWYKKVNRDINFSKINEDINGILIELKDIGYNIHITSKYQEFDYFTININKGKNSQTHETGISNFNIIDIKDYLDTCVDYMDIYYNYKLEVKFIQAFSSKEEEFDNYELHLDKRVKSLILIFYDLTIK